jgi:hypothetical protein
MEKNTGEKEEEMENRKAKRSTRNRGGGREVITTRKKEIN